jgi:RNA polymerase sigma-70 factor (ECF subfamily)
VTPDELRRSDDLLARALAMDMSAFAALVRMHQRSVYSLALRMLSDRHAAEDLAQEVFLQMHRNLSSLQSGAHLAFWLRKVTMNRAIDRLRRERPHEVASLDEADELASEANDPDPLLQRRLARLVGQLPPAPRAVLLLRYQEDLDPTSIARALGMSINTVKSHLKRSLAVLRDRLAGRDAAATDGPACRLDRISGSGSLT